MFNSYILEYRLTTQIGFLNNTMFIRPQSELSQEVACRRLLVPSPVSTVERAR